MADYINREKIQYREIVDYYDEQNMCEIHCDVADKVKIERLPTADVVERSKVNKAIEEMKALADPKNTILGFDEKMGLKVAINILLRNSGYAPDTNVGSKADGMTKEESIDIMKAIIYMLEPMYDTDRVEEAVSMAIKALKQESPLDKIRAEIDELDVLKYSSGERIYKDEVLDIIDKYKVESEEE